MCIICPKCGSTNIVEMKDGYHCKKCGNDW